MSSLFLLPIGIGNANCSSKAGYMTTKEASEKFHLDIKEVRARIKDKMIPDVYKKGSRIIIPDETSIFPSKNDIKQFLFQIIKYKNNNSTVISRELCPQAEQLQALMAYLYKRGFIGKYIFSEDIRILFDNVQLTDSGLEFVFGQNAFAKLSGLASIPLQLNPSFNTSISAIAIKVG